MGRDLRAVVLCTLLGGLVLAMGRADVAPEHPTGPPARRVDHMVLYSVVWGGRSELRLRSLPFPGTERVLWRSPADEDDGWNTLYYVPSPSYGRVAVCWYTSTEGGGKLYVVALDTGRTEVVVSEPTVRYMLWRGEDVLSWLDHSAEHSLDLSRGTTTTRPVTEDMNRSALDYLTPPFAEQIDAIKQLARGGALSLGMDGKYADRAVLRCVGVPLGLSLTMFGAWWLAALSPDGELAAVTSGRQAVFVINVHTRFVRRVIPVEKLLQWERVSIRDVRWSPDSKTLTFTEVHYNPAQWHFGDFGPRPEALDSAYIVRAYTPATDEVNGLVYGSDAFLLPTSVLSVSEAGARGSE
jgi:hypothetical protein